jgi:hypothetical protein
LSTLAAGGDPEHLLDLLERRDACSRETDGWVIAHEVIEAARGWCWRFVSPVGTLSTSGT